MSTNQNSVDASSMALAEKLFYDTLEKSVWVMSEDKSNAGYPKKLGYNGLGALLIEHNGEIVKCVPYTHQNVFSITREYLSL